MPPEKQHRKTPTMWLFALICAPLLISLVDCARDLYCDMALIRRVALHSQIDNLRSQTARRAGRLESLLETNSQPAAPTDQHWRLAKSQPWLQSHWAAAGQPGNHQVYSAIVDNSGMIVLHTRPDAMGGRLTSEWDDHKQPEAGDDVVRVSGSPLAPGATAFDVHVPITAQGRTIGRYHAGLDADWFDRDVAAQQRRLLVSRSWIVALIVAANVGALVGLIYLGREFAALGERLSTEVRQRTRQLRQIGMGLAHEIRNPLHALRINVHTLRRSFAKGPLNEQQMTDMMRESDDEIDHLDALMRDFVQYAVPQAGDRVDIDVSREIQATLSLLGEELKRKQIETRTRFAAEPVSVHIDPSRLRQAALTLLTFASKSAGQKGRIDIDVAARDGQAEIVIADSGPALSEADQASLFEPFQHTSHSNSGLAMALVRRFIEEAGGSIDRHRQSPQGSCFHIWLPLAKHNSQGT